MSHSDNPTTQNRKVALIERREVASMESLRPINRWPLLRQILLRSGVLTVGALYAALQLATFLISQIMSPEDQAKYQLIKLLSSWRFWFLATVSLTVLLIGLIVRAAFQVINKQAAAHQAETLELCTELDAERAKNLRPELKGLIGDYAMQDHPSFPNRSWLQVIIKVSFHNARPVPALIRNYSLKAEINGETHIAPFAEGSELCKFDETGNYSKVLNLATFIGSNVTQDTPLDGYLEFILKRLPMPEKASLMLAVAVGFDDDEYLMPFRPDVRDGGASRVSLCEKPL